MSILNIQYHTMKLALKASNDETQYEGSKMQRQIIDSS
jgi:hypothetical protein